MADLWQLWCDDPDERAAFATLAAVQRWPRELAGPRNRRRHVERVRGPHGVVYLKCFGATQWRNRLQFACTAPRARDDADRERQVTQALRGAGIGAPRPLAYGRVGANSYYLCETLPGSSCHDRCVGGVEPGLANAVARFCGGLLRGGFWLPDLGADHVFVDGPGGSWRFGVLDLHNGRLAPGRKVPRWLAVRVLRRWIRSVHDLALPWSLALRFAVRLLRSATVSASQRRAVLRRLPPWATAARYDVAGKSREYAERNPRRAARELSLLARVWPGHAGECVLDLPCGAGRLVPFLRERGHALLHADGSLAMLREGRSRCQDPPPAVVADALAMPFAAHAVDGVVMFRFLHHLPPAASRRAIDEACRVANRFVVVSFFHPVSAHHWRRTLQAWWRGRSPTRFTRRLALLRRWFASHGFQLTGYAADRAFARDLWLAAFVRQDASDG